jgi:3',5'-cyclic AMP phosphodiesterase CpdA
VIVIGEFARSFIIGLIFASTRAVIAMVCVTLVVFLIARGNLERTRNYLVPVFAAFDLLVRRFFAAATIAAVAMVITIGVPEGSVPWPAPGSLERVWGEKIIGIWWVLFVAESLWSAGFPPALEPSIRLKNIQAFRAMALVLSAAVVVWPGHYLIGALLTSFAYLGFAAHFGRRLAMAGYVGSLPIDPLPLAKFAVGADLVFIHATDLHVTASPTHPRVESERPGNTRLADLPGALPGQPRWLFITGDLVDHGRDDEWCAAYDLLSGILETAPSARFIVAPGNHDVGTAYNSVDNLGAQLLARHHRRLLADTDSRYLRRYLTYAARLDPDLRVATGDRLAEILAADQAAESEVADRLEEIAAAPTAERRAIVAARARELYADVPDVDWDVAVTLSAFRFKDIVVPALWLRRWFSVFPLWHHDDAHRELVIVLNSVAPDPTHLGGAWGSIGEAQAARLRSRLEATRARKTFVLCHHAPVRWTDEPPPPWFAVGANTHWSTTSVLAEDVVRLRDTLGEALRNGSEEIIFLCGHRHGGSTHSPRIGSWPGGRLGEGASFADSGTALIAGWEGDCRPIELGIVT